MNENRFDALARVIVAPTEASAVSLRGLLGGGGEKWAGGLARSGSGRAIHHATARQNARAAMQESMQARAVVERSADVIADGGLRLQLAPITEVLGITREYAAAWSKDTAMRFDMWAKSKRQHRSGTMNWYQSQQFWQLCRHRDNDQFVRLFYSSDPGLQNPLQFDFLDPDQIRGDALTTSPYGYTFGQYTSTGAFQGLYDGIERDEDGRETGYKVWVRKADGSYIDVVLPSVYPGGRTAMLHGFTPEYAGQGRGYSRLSHALQEFENITDFSSAAIKKAINQSNIVAFVEPSPTEDASNPLEELLTRGASVGPAAKLFGADPQPVEGIPVVPDRVGLDTFASIPEANLTTPGSLFVATLTKGSTLKPFQTTAPGDSFNTFVDAFAGHLAASLRIPLEVVLMKFGQNYSASRATLLLFWRVACIERDEMATDYLNPVVESWLSEEIAAARIVAPGWNDPRMRAAWLNCTWVGSGPPDIDPAKSAKARRDNLEMGATNIELEAVNHNGTSAADNIAKNNAAYDGYQPLPWNEPGNPPPGSAAPAPAAALTGKMLAALVDEFRMVLREELDAG